MDSLDAWSILQNEEIAVANQVMKNGLNDEDLGDWQL